MYCARAAKFPHLNHRRWYFHCHWFCLLVGVDSSISPEMFRNHRVIASIDFRLQIEVDSAENWWRSLGMSIRCNSNLIYHRMDCLATILLIYIVGIRTIQCTYPIRLDLDTVGTNNRSICCVANNCVSAECIAMVDNMTEKSLRLFLFQLKRKMF